MSKTKKDLKRAIERLRFLSDKDKDNWLLLIQNLDKAGIDKIYDLFTNVKQGEDNFMLKLIYQAGLKNELIKALDKNTKKIIKKINESSGKS